MITVVINGVDFDYPEVGDSEWGDPATKAFQSLCATTLQKVGGSFTLENDLTFGGNKGIHCLFFSSVGSDPALSGVYRLSKNELVAWRNEWNTDDFAITVDSTSGDLLIKSNELESYVDPDDGQTKYRPVLDGNGDPIPVVRRVAISGEIVNADVADSAGILESKLALDYSTDSLHTLISDKALYNLADTDLPDPTSTPPDTPPNNQDVLLYDNNDSKWKNSNLLSSHVGNTTNPHLTNIVNLVDTKVVTPTKDDTLLYDDVESKWKNKPNTVTNLKDTAISTPLSGQVLTYDGNDSTWKNQPSASASLTGLTDTDISTTPPPDNGDVLSFDSNDSKWKNSNALTSHLGDKNNPHETNVDNLDDTNIDSNNLNDEDVLLYDLASQEWVNSNKLSSHITDTNNPHSTSIDNLSDSDIDSDTLTENDVMVFNDQTSKWENSQILVNHIGNAANPHLTTVAKLTDANITTPANKDLLQYDYANSQWINSSDVWSTIEINDIAYVGATPNGHPIVNGVVTMEATDNRTQFLDLSSSSTGYIIKLPSTGVKKGEMFTFYTGGINAANISKALHFQCSDGTLNVYYYNSCFVYRFMAVADNPTAAPHWISSTTVRRYTEIVNTAIEKTNLSYTANTRVTYDSSTVALCPGRWLLTLEWTIAKGNSPSAITDPWYISLNYKNNGTAQGFNSRMGGAFGANIPMGSNGNTTIETQTVYYAAMPAYNTTKLVAVNNVETAYIQMSVKSSSATTGAYLCGRLSGYLVYPHTGALT